MDAGMRRGARGGSKRCRVAKALILAFLYVQRSARQGTAL
ncbi:hypothetical protein Y024_5630 [Burkholderia pseudomallei TSV44]|nr:hypothetical protein DM75_2715 [Burkholderia mallei]KGS19484.1 hypothetical protein X989_4229 [Burkholderia pseudomallei MSHR4378]KGS42907.1 hypothetical protein X945_3572 [Burkholderia pseudomallei ABCPW 107]KGS82770.1 hypothetical protein X947_3458 [Burkholderia pseudomallei MSHR7334]KGW36352.1 hypothetical protein Y602_5710 [Burkholderia pseudomallei MSHR733]KGX51767.1 hypothetical protein Y024_5630 [Burkholderia pseudomallei TSV44]